MISNRDMLDLFIGLYLMRGGGVVQGVGLINTGY